jgi:hypothetical protein
LYRVMRSGCFGFDKAGTELALAFEEAEGAGAGG